MEINRFCELDKRIDTDMVVALGNFDGVHIGHSQLIEIAVSESKNIGGHTAVWNFIYNNSKAPLIIDCDDKIGLFQALGAAAVVTADFEELRDLPPAEFVRDVLVARLHCRVAVCGFNYRFGRNAAGNADDLRSLMVKNGGSCVIVPPVVADGEIVSSTLIRTLIARGETDRVIKFLGRPYSLRAPVIGGARLGTRLDFPTINQLFPDNMIKPRHGVYCTQTSVDGAVYNCVTNVGIKPTVSESGAVTCETHLLHFSGDLYGKTLRVRFYKKLRDEMKFSSLNDLKSAVEHDIKSAETYFCDMPEGYNT
jgi:riboflavin kinase/FMN adenylyltransferase